jgi:hypothetical protein
MNCFQRKTRIEAPDSGAGPFQVGSARATPGMSSNPAAPDCKTRRLVTSIMSSSLAGAAFDAAALLLSIKSTLRSDEGKARRVPRHRR